MTPRHFAAGFVILALATPAAVIFDHSPERVDKAPVALARWLGAETDLVGFDLVEYAPDRDPGYVTGSSPTACSGSA